MPTEVRGLCLGSPPDGGDRIAGVAPRRLDTSSGGLVSPDRLLLSQTCGVRDFIGGEQDRSTAETAPGSCSAHSRQYDQVMRRRALSIQPDDLAGIQYAGMSGLSHPCLNAMRRLVQCGDQIEQALIVTCRQHHAFLLYLGNEHQVAVRSGFTSGYNGEGPRALADALLLMQAVGAEVDECSVPEDVLTRFDLGILTMTDLELIESARRTRPMRWYDYVYDVRAASRNDSDAWKGFRPVMPWAIIDERVIDLAKAFFDAPSDSILRGFRRLEDSVRSRTGLADSGAKLFSQAFATDDSILRWDVRDSGEQKGRAQLFVGAFMAYRNAHAHRELAEESDALLHEFLLLNHLFVLERSSIVRTIESSPEPKI